MAYPTGSARRLAERVPALPPILVDLSEAQHALSLGRNSVHELVKSGRLRSVRVGRRVLIPVDALTEFAHRSVSVDM